MSPCSPSDTHINTPTNPGIPLAPFGGIPFSPIQLPIPNLDIPNIESVLDLINTFTARMPSGVFKPNLDDLTNNILKAITNLFDQLAPYLSIYNLFQAALNLIACIINVLCAIPNPFKMFKAMRKLFKKCLPDFFNLLPFLALLAMIISLLLLIIALIEYIIVTVEKLIEDLLANLINLGEGLTLQNDDAVAATAKKIAQLVCLMENLFSILIAIGAIIDIINALAGRGGISVCGGGGAPGVGDDDCCGEDVCPPFIIDNPNGISGTLGTLTYYHTINTDIQSIFGSLTPSQISQFNLPSLRTESWQFVDEAINQLYQFSDIITPLGEQENIFWPEGISYNKDANKSKVPYTLDLTMKTFDPIQFNTSDKRGPREFVIKDVIVSKKPYIGIINQDNLIDTNINNTGTLSLLGGLVYEKNETLGLVPYTINGSQATLNTLIHQNATFGNLPTYNDGYIIENINYTLNINYPVLNGYGLITLGCSPDLFVERVIANEKAGTSGFESIANKLPIVGTGGILPDVNSAQLCLSNAINKLRQNVSAETVAEFQTEIDVCLTQLKNETKESYCNILQAAVSIYESKLINNVDVEFITRTIKTTVKLYDVNGTLISNNILPECIPVMENLLNGEVTFGSITKFVYNGTDAFTAEISSKIAGNGQVTVSYNGNTLKRILNSDDNNVQTVSEDQFLTYQFIGTKIISKVTDGIEELEETKSRDETDVARDGSI